MGDLEVAIEDLKALGKRLGTLGDDLKKVDGHSDYGTDDLAHSKVVDAMDNFRGNWDDNRDHLADKLGKLGNLATKAAEGFTEADQELAKKIRELMEGKPK